MNSNVELRAESLQTAVDIRMNRKLVSFSNKTNTK